jgi:recombination protein RecA
VSKETQLADAVKDINKQFGAGTLVKMSDHKAAASVSVISTGNKVIDGLLSIGGLPRGRVSEIYGPEAGGKTTLCLQVLAQAQALGGVVAYIDAEHALDINYAHALGVNVDEMFLSQPDTGEDALEIVQMLIKSGGITAIVVDSVAALVPRAELEGDMGDAQMGLQARLMSQAMRKLNGAVKTTDTALIFINQIRDKIGVMFGNPETTTGGRALKFYSSIRIDIRRISQIKKSDVIIGQNVKVKIVKNKFAAPYRDAEIPLIYGKGLINPEAK